MADRLTYSDVTPRVINLPERRLRFKEGTIKARIVLGTVAPHIEITGSVGTRISAQINLTDDDITAMMDGLDKFRAATISTMLEKAANEVIADGA